MSFLLPVFHAGQAIGSIYAATYSIFAISNLQNREEQTKRAAQYSNTAAHQLHKTRTTQTSGALAVSTTSSREHTELAKVFNALTNHL